MSEQPPIPVVAGESLSSADKRLIALFDKLEEEQLNFLDQAGKRVIELSTAMIALLFTVTAFGKDFPPPYLVANKGANWLALLALAAYVIALFAGIIAVQPRRYARAHHGLTNMRKELDTILAHKSRWFRFGMACLFVGTLALATLVTIIIWPA